jgi:hypothetical protein
LPVLQGATVVYVYNLLMGAHLTGVLLRAVARHCRPGTRVVLHTSISDQAPDVRDAFQVLAEGFRQWPARRKGGAAVRGPSPAQSDGTYGSKRFLGTPCVLELLHSIPARIST